MKELYRGIKVIYNYYNFNIMGSILGNIFMAILNIVLIMNGGSYYLIGVILFYLLMSLLRLSTFILYKLKKSNYKIGLFYAVSSTIIYLLIPSLLVYVLTVKQYEPFFIDWFTYAYALFATLKMTFAFMHIKKTIMDKDIYLMDIKLGNIVVAFYTVFLLAFVLINSNGDMDDKMMTMMIFLNALVIIAAIVALIIMYRILKWGKKND